MDITDRTPFPEADVTRNFSHILLKFSERRYLEELRAGYVFLRPQEHFRKLENDSVRSDRFETFDKMFQPHDVKSLRLTNNETGQIFQLRPTAPILMRTGKESYNVFCMYAVPTSTAGSLAVDFQNFGFGDCFLVVLDSQKFINRVKRAAEKMGFGMDCHLIEYINTDTYSGEVGPFRKPRSFEFQHEFRIIISPGTIQPVKLKVRTLQDITSPIYPLNEINQLVQVNSAGRMG